MTLTIEESVNLYLSDVANRCAPTTVIHYRKRLSSFIKQMGDKPLSELDSASIKDHLEREKTWETGKRSGQSKAPDTIRSTVVAWEQLQKWLIDNEHLENPITKKKLIKPMGRKRDILPTKEETKTILDRCPEDFRSIYLALRLTGARPGELCKSQIADLDRQAGEIVLKEHKTARKTGKPRRIAVGHPSLVSILQTAIGDRTEGHIFLRSNGKPWKPEIISGLYRAARLAAGLRPGLVPYLARHEHATNLYLVLGDLKAVADLLGHSNIATTMRYTRFNLNQAKNNQAKFDDSLD